MDELILFDSFSYFLILTKILGEEKNCNIIKEIEYDKESFDDITLKGTSITNSGIGTFIEIIFDKSLSFNKIYIKDDLYEFIYKVSLINENIDEEHLFKACLHILNYNKNKEIIKSNNEDDFFEAHSELFRGENYLKKKSEEVIYMIDLYKEKKIKKKKI